ncbi:MAG: molybdopterin-dependent oxidoreductase [Armatimonadota bacterium]|nr:molybdopterin-dependent oxidoreductase [Armatimonadota bacterium]MDW8025264.1 molybdopterin-dependent oxidoreductase [Armatimonadota bacterium]
MVSMRTTCGFCGCGCGLYTVSDDNGVIGVIPSDADPVNEGRLCIRGWHVYQPLRNMDRIFRPVAVLNGSKRDVDYTDALSRVAEGLKKFPPNQIGIIGSATSTNEDAYLIAKFGRAVIGTNHIDFPGRSRLMPTLMMLRLLGEGVSMPCTFADLMDADLLLCIGIGDPNRYPQASARIFKAVVEGGHLLLIDTWHSDFAPYASLHISPKPFSGALLLRALAGILDSTIKVPFADEQISSITGVSSEQLRAAADLLLSSKRLAAVYDTASLMHMCSPQCVYELARLIKVLRERGVEWCGILPMVERCNSNGALRMGVAPMLLPGLKSVTDNETAQKACSLWGIDSLPQDVGMGVAQMLSAIENGELKALIIVGDDLLTDVPDEQRLKKVLSKVELLIAISAYRSLLTEAAHFVFPRAIWGEAMGTFVNMEGRMRCLEKVAERLGEARQEWQVLCDIATAMGIKLSYSCSDEVLDELKRLVPEYASIEPDKISNSACLIRERLSHLFDGVMHEEIAVPELPLVSDEFPLLLLVERYYLPWHADTLALHSSTLWREFRLRFTPHVFVNSVQGHSLGLRDGMPALLKTPQGSARVTSVFNEAVPTGIAILPEMFFAQLRGVVGQEKFDELTGTIVYPATVAAMERTR